MGGGSAERVEVEEKEVVTGHAAIGDVGVVVERFLLGVVCCGSNRGADGESSSVSVSVLMAV